MVGEKEETNNAVNVRTRDNKIHGEISVTSAIDKLKNLKQSRTLNAEEEFWRPFPVRSLCNLILTPKLAFSLITISTSKNLEPIVSSAAGHCEKRVWNWVVDTHKIWFTHVSTDKGQGWEILNFLNVLRNLNGKMFIKREKY